MMPKTHRDRGGTRPIVTYPQRHSTRDAGGGETVNADTGQGDPPGVPQPDQVSGYGDLTVEELRRELGERDLSTSGRKDVLVARLIDDDSEE